MQKIFRLLLVASAIVLGAFWFVHWSRTRALNSGDVHVRAQPQQPVAAPEAPEAASANQPPQPQEIASSEPAAAPPGQPLARQQPVAAMRASDTISRNPPNGIVAAGSGRFQLYRQGDMTFRLNTDTGQACVLFATEAQWRKTLVYEHGCGNR